ncbi:hypothetical protein ACOSQ2_014772 [Xanthoceras sorbifolium]
MLTARVYNVDEAYQLALQLEKQSNVSYYRRHQPTDLGVPRPSTTFKQKIIEETMKNGVVGDTRSKTKLTGDGPQCYKCKGFGHFTVVCPTRDKRIAYVCEKDLIFDDEAEASGSQPTLKTDEPEKEEEEVLQAANLPLCVINRALNVIIDNGSGMNVISKAVVERLNLPQQPHPTPYRVSWINDVNTVPVKYRCLVKFSLGTNYVDEVWCDVLPITVCHLLLGRPWLYDRHVVYDGFKNSYSFVFKKKNHLRTTTYYVQFSVGDQVLIRLRPERFPPGSFTKLHARRAGPFPILKKLGPNAYLVDLPGSYTFSHIFNVEDLTAYKGTNVQDQGIAAETVPRIPSTPQNHNNVDDILDHQFPISEAVWLQAQEIQRLNPELFHAYTLQNLPESIMVSKSPVLSTTFPCFFSLRGFDWNP